MHHVNICKTVAHDWQDLFALVLDMERYPLFVPCCTRVRILSRHDLGPDSVEIVSRMTVGLLPLQISYINRTTADRARRRIGVASSDGPLRHLHVLWRFEPHGPARTDIGIDASYEFRSPILAAMATGLFERMLTQLVDAFERRADQFAAAEH